MVKWGWKINLAKAICGFIQTEGTYFSKGEDIKSDSVKERAERVGYVLQNPNQMISTNMIFDEVALGLRLRNVPEDQIESRVHQALKTVVSTNFVSGRSLLCPMARKSGWLLLACWPCSPSICCLMTYGRIGSQRAGSDGRDHEKLVQAGTNIIVSSHDMDLMYDCCDYATCCRKGI